MMPSLLRDTPDGNVRPAALSPERTASILQRFGNLRAYYYQKPADAFERDEIDRLTDDVTIGQPG
jgi:hypothetical protein